MAGMSEMVIFVVGTASMVVGISLSFSFGSVANASAVSGSICPLRREAAALRISSSFLVEKEFFRCTIFSLKTRSRSSA